jgi:hypothetical protein
MPLFSNGGRLSPVPNLLYKETKTIPVPSFAATATPQCAVRTCRYAILRGIIFESNE